MRTKAIKDLAQLSDADFFEYISLGYEQVLKHALALDADAQVLARESHITSNRILSVIAEEEAAKCLILLDSVRCPRKPSELLTKHLGKFNSHLAKRIYEEACYLTFSGFSDCINFVTNELNAFYIEDPTDLNWILPNRLTSDREGILYVDYCEMDDGSHKWLIPSKGSFWKKDTPFSLLLAKAFYDTGCITPRSLQVIADFWRHLSISDSTTFQELRDMNYQTIKELNKHDF